MKKKKLQEERKLVFSFMDGSLLEYLTEDASKMTDGYHLILDQYPYGCKKHPDERLYIGKDLNTGFYIPCQKCITKLGNKKIMGEISEKMFDKMMDHIQSNPELKKQFEEQNENK